MPHSQQPITITDLLELLKQHKGRIISTASIKDTIWIDQARAGGRMYVDENGFGFIWEPEEFFLTDEKGVELIEKWFPLDIPMPERLKDPENIFRRMKEKNKINKQKEQN